MASLGLCRLGQLVGSDGALTVASVPVIQGTASRDGVVSGALSTRARWWTAGAVYVVLIVLCSLAGYWAMFSQFAPYDDEGFFDYTLKLFNAGHPLYTVVFSDYGPFYYEFFRGLFALVGHAVTTDLGRLIQLVLWVSASVGLDVAAHRRTGRLAISIAVLATSFSLMSAAIVIRSDCLERRERR